MHIILTITSAFGSGILVATGMVLAAGCWLLAGGWLLAGCCWLLLAAAHP
jgi:hypothetical protein